MVTHGRCALRTPLALAFATLLALGASSAQGQMMGNPGGRGSREAQSERLASASPDQRAYLEALREGRAGSDLVVQSVTMGAGFRKYALGSGGVSEWTSRATYSLRRPALRLRVSGGLLRFSDGDTLSISGASPIDARLDIAVGARDSLRFQLRTPSSPSSLTAPEVSALASVGTSTVDLSSIEFGTPANVSARLTHLQPLGASTMLSAMASGDFEPRPSTAEWSYWRGTTVGLGLRFVGTRGGTRISGELEVTRSFTDSLDGRNLFQGGGTVLARVELASLMGEAGENLIDVSAFYFSPYSTNRSDAATRHGPVGDLMGASAMGVWPVSEVIVMPIVLLSRESSRVTSGGGEIQGSGWSLGTALALDVPLGQGFALTPEFGFARGSVRTDLIQTTPGGGRLGITDSLTGWWAQADLSFSF